MDIKQKKPILIDEDKVWEIRDYAWSPDSNWVAYAKHYENQLTSIFLYSLASGKISEVTSDFTNKRSPYFDPEGKYLYFISARNYNAALDSKDENFIYQKNEGVYLVTLRSEIASPFLLASDESEITPQKHKETTKEKAVEKKTKEKESFRIGLYGITNKIVMVPITAGNYNNLQANKGNLFYIASPVIGLSGPYPKEKKVLYRFNIEKKKETALLEGLDSYTLSVIGEKILYAASQKDTSDARKTYGIIKSDIETTAKIGDGALKLTEMLIKVNLCMKNGNKCSMKLGDWSAISFIIRK